MGSTHGVFTHFPRDTSQQWREELSTVSPLTGHSGPSRRLSAGTLSTVSPGKWLLGLGQVSLRPCTGRPVGGSSTRCSPAGRAAWTLLTPMRCRGRAMAGEGGACRWCGQCSVCPFSEGGVGLALRAGATGARTACHPGEAGQDPWSLDLVWNNRSVAKCCGVLAASLFWAQLSYP